MPRTPGSRRAFRFPWLSTRQVVADVDAELAFHLARKAEEFAAAGLSADDARREAAQRFGDLEYTRRYCRDEDVRRERESRHMTIMQELEQDIVYALRSLRSAPGFALVALLTLALGIGANTAIFSVVRGVLLRPLPFPAAEQVVRVWHANRSANEARSQVSEPDFKEWLAASRRFASLSAYWYQPGGSGADLTGIGNPERIEGVYVTPGFFETLRAPAALGRTIRPEEAVIGNDRFVVLSDGFWRRRFGADPSVIGRALTMDGVPHTVLGVMAPGFNFPADRIDYWMPLSTIPADGIGRQRSSRFLDVIGRLAPGVTPVQAHDELAAVARRTAAQEPEAKDWTDVTIAPVREAVVGEVRRPLLVLLGAVAFVLLITCANIASLLLARATARQREIAVRSALGAGRGRILRQLLTESLVLALAGGALGVALAYLGVRALGAVGAAELPRASAIRIDAVVLLYALGVSTAAGLLFGLLPALRATSQNLQAMLRAGSRGSVGAGGQRLRSTLVVAEVALAVVLVVGAGLAAKSFARLLNVDPGFQPTNVLAVKLSIPSERYPDERYPAYYEALLTRIAAVPGVQAVGAAKNFPLRGVGEIAPKVVVPGKAGGAGDRELRLPLLHVSADYFRAMGIPLRAGRVFTAADKDDTPPVWVVNEALARRYFPGESAVGKTLRVGQSSIQIVGVVGDIRQRTLTEPAEPTLYIHYLQNRRSGLSLAVRTTGDPLRYANAVRRAIWEVDRDQTITSVETMSAIVGGTVARPRLLATLLVLFGVMGLLLGALGIYGVLAFAVSQRRQEIGVRVALGATPRSVLALVVGQGMTLALAGVVVGVVGALALTRVLAAVLYEVRATDPATFVMVVAVLLGAAFVASWLPARRALRIDPVQALRYD
ncbi:MAG: ABC transporter permease [Gemmatimonadaceae bacterium]